MRAFSVAIAAVAGLAGVATAGDPGQIETLTIGAAPSLRAAFHEILPLFEKEYGVTVRVVYGPSKILHRQIEQGDPMDVFLPEGVAEVEKLQKKGLTLNGGLRTYAQTSLVLVTSTTSPAASISFRDGLPDRATRIALGDPKTSALGEITARALTKLDPSYRHRSRLLHAPHSDEVVNLVHTGEADVGVVYRADAISSGYLRIIDEVPPGMHAPVPFGVAVVWTCRDASLRAAEAFLDFITSPRIQKLLLKYGFDSLPSNG